MKFWNVFKSTVFNIYVACNMLLCSILFLGFSKPRETISGFVGRTFQSLAIYLSIMAQDGKDKTVEFRVLNPIAYALLYLARFIDWCFGERGHCGETAEAEEVMRQELYPEVK